jgi:hypothetical protein
LIGLWLGGLQLCYRTRHLLLRRGEAFYTLLHSSHIPRYFLELQEIRIGR